MFRIAEFGFIFSCMFYFRVIMYDNLYKGSQLPYVEQAISDGYEVVVLNTNVNSKSAEVDSWKGRVPIRVGCNLFFSDSFCLIHV